MTPRFHKRPCKYGFIAGASNATTKKHCMCKFELEINKKINNKKIK